MLNALIVEDNLRFRQSMKEILQTQFPKMVIMEAEDGREAFQQIGSSPPDLIFMDIRLPGENGLELTQKIKANFPQIVVIILTSYDLPEYREAATRHGANHFLVKGSSSGEEIAAVVRSFFGNLGDRA